MPTAVSNDDRNKLLNLVHGPDICRRVVVDQDRSARIRHDTDAHMADSQGRYDADVRHACKNAHGPAVLRRDRLRVDGAVGRVLGYRSNPLAKIGSPSYAMRNVQAE